MACLPPILEGSLPARRSFVTALHSHMESAFLPFVLDHESMLCLDGAEGLRSCQTTCRDIQEETRLSIGGTCAQLCDAGLLTLERSRDCLGGDKLLCQCPPFYLLHQWQLSLKQGTASASLRVFHTRNFERMLSAG